MRSAALGTLTLRLAEPLVVRAVTAPGLGRLLTLRVKGQNSVIVNLPRVLARDDELTLTVSYAGRLPGATPEREAIAVAQEQEIVREQIVIPVEPRTRLHQPQLLVPAGAGRPTSPPRAAPDRAGGSGVRGERHRGVGQSRARRRHRRRSSSGGSTCSWSIGRRATSRSR